MIVNDPSYLNPFVSNWPGFAAFLGVFLLLRLLGSPTLNRWRGDAIAVRNTLRKLDPALYQVYHDVRLPRPDRQSHIEIDHVVVSQFGIFVIERIHLRGLISGDARQCLWTQRIRRHSRSFDNPLHQNRMHVRALAGYLGMTDEFFHPAALFVSTAVFKTPMPDNVLNRNLLPWIMLHNTPLLDSQALYRATSRFDSLTRSTHRKSATPATAAPLKAHRASSALITNH